MSDQKRPYRMKRRAELEEATRLRITDLSVAPGQPVKTGQVICVISGG